IPVVNGCRNDDRASDRIHFKGGRVLRRGCTLKPASPKLLDDVAAEEPVPPDTTTLPRIPSVPGMYARIVGRRQPAFIDGVERAVPSTSLGRRIVSACVWKVICSIEDSRSG